MTKKANKTLRIFLWILVGLVGLIGIFLLVLCLRYPPQYVFRAITWGEASADDYLRLPERDLAASPNPFYFAEQTDEELVEASFQTSTGVGDLDAFLTKTGTQAFIVIQDDAILYEGYFNGARRDSIVTSFSVAKSFASALVGIAIQEGYIQSADDPITNYLPELAARDPRFGKITIRYLLMMSSGLRYDDERPLLDDDGTLTYLYTDLRSLALEQTEITGPPGKKFLYNNYNPLLLGMILERATGRSVTDYLQEKIWAPLGMEFGGSWSLDSQTTGFEKMESGINARAIDFAKLGRLYLSGGSWDGAQIVPTEWVEVSTQDNGLIPSGPLYYGQMWWGSRCGQKGRNFYAWGNLGQFIYVSTGSDLIIVRNGERYGLGGEGEEWAALFCRFARDFQNQ